MIKVTPMDDELAIGHEGRIAWVNAVANQREFDRLMASSSSQSEQHKLDKRSKLSQLAAHAEMSPTNYARKHSMLPAFRVAAKHGEDLMHGDAQGESFSRRLGMLTQKPGAYICQSCVNDDLKKSQRSWYRRDHHLHGVDWCPSHEITLSEIKAPNPWAAFPHHWIEAGEIESACKVEHGQQDMAFLRCYAEISVALLDQDTPLDVRAVGYLIGKRAQHLGLRTSINGQRSTISDHILLKAPEKWLKTHFSHISEKETSGFIAKIDAAVISRTIPAQGYVYGLALASLFDTSGEAIQYLNASVPADVVARVKTPSRRDAGFWHGEFWDIYVQHGGLAARIAESLGMDKTYLQEKMSTLGMPSLHNVGASKSWRALMRLHGGEGFRSSCELEKVDEKDVEYLLRTVNPKVVALACNIVGSSWKDMAVVTTNFPPLRSTCDAQVRTVSPAPNQEFNRFIDTVVAGQGSALQQLETMAAA
ncbi:TniQ family protein [Rhodoferax ferrireducens]|nr:TniQ family protein [Rhodoferax ferrireducens]